MVGEAFARRQKNAPALAHPGVRRGILGDAQQCVADLREELDVLVTVDEVRRASECGIERLELPQNLDRQQLRLEQAQVARCSVAASDRNASRRSGSKPWESG